MDCIHPQGSRREGYIEQVYNGMPLVFKSFFKRLVGHAILELAQKIEAQKSGVHRNGLHPTHEHVPLDSTCSIITYPPRIRDVPRHAEWPDSDGEGLKDIRNAQSEDDAPIGCGQSTIARSGNHDRNQSGCDERDAGGHQLGNDELFEGEHFDSQISTYIYRCHGVENTGCNA